MVQTWDPARYQKNAAFVPELGAGVMEWLAPEPGEAVLDLGCGDGVLTRKLAETGAAVIGVDASAALVAAARDRGLDVQVMDGQALELDRCFDAVFSNAALHWMTDPDAVIRGVHAHLKPGGRFVGEFGGKDNVARIRAALEAELAARGVDPAPYNPWYFPDEDDYRARLEAAGFSVDRIERFERPTPLPGDVVGWLHTFAESYLKAVPESDRAVFLERVRDRVADSLRQEDGSWYADYVRLRFAARKPAAEGA